MVIGLMVESRQYLNKTKSKQSRYGSGMLLRSPRPAVLVHDVMHLVPLRRSHELPGFFSVHLGSRGALSRHELPIRDSFGCQTGVDGATPIGLAIHSAGFS